MAAQTWFLSPSDFAFLWEECKRCFYLKVVSNFRRPSPPMPKIFGVIDGLMNAHFAGKRTTDVCASLPGGVVQYGENWVQSTPIAFSTHSSKVILRGKLDTVLRFDDGSYAVVDFKSSERSDEHIPLYGRQLHAYAYSLENAAPNNLALKPVARLGLLVFEPNAFFGKVGGSTSLSGDLVWIEIPRDDAAFLTFLDEVLDILEQPSPPGGSAACPWCIYRDTSRRTGL